MLKIITSMRDMDFGALMEIYAQGNRENGALLYPHASPSEQVLLAEQDFYQYLTQCFFALDGAVYALWEQDGRKVAALRLEPYRDGLLLEALETAPDQRRRGYACHLLQAVQEWLGHHGRMKVYSHVNRKNTASQRTHQSCGFIRILDHAVYADGSVLLDSDTFLFEVQ